jgi:hypothetical protein
LYRAACTALAPDLAALSGVRYGLLSICTKRAKFLQADIYPLLVARRGSAFSTQVEALDKDLVAKRRTSSEHIAKWPIGAVQADWPGYRAAAARIGELVETRLMLEQSVILSAFRAPAIHRVA